MSFSVVIPLYNKALHIERALRSVFEQTYQDFEIIVINDGSTDNGQVVVENIHDPRIRLINQTNQGVSVARNHGIEAASSEFIAFLDADDEWNPEFLINIQNLIDDFPGCGLYASAVQTIRPNGDMYFPSLNKLPSDPWNGIIPNFFELFQEGLSIFLPSSAVIPKSILKEVGGFPAGIKLSEDIVCWTKVAFKYPIAFTSKRLVEYHQEAVNRSNVHKNLGEEPFISTIQEAIKAGTISKRLIPEALEFIAQRQIIQATANVIAGNPRNARYLLSKCPKTKKYKRKWLWWQFWALFPAGWPNKLITFKQKYLS